MIGKTQIISPVTCATEELVAYGSLLVQPSFVRWQHTTQPALLTRTSIFNFLFTSLLEFFFINLNFKLQPSQLISEIIKRIKVICKVFKQNIYVIFNVNQNFENSSLTSSTDYGNTNVNIVQGFKACRKREKTASFEFECGHVSCVIF